MTWYSQYTGDCIGRVLHFLYIYGGLSLSDNVTVGSENIYISNKKIATYSIRSEMEVEGIGGWKFTSKYVPIFRFEGPHSNLNKVQNKLQRVAILQSIVYEAKADIKELENKLHRFNSIKNIWSNLPDSDEYKEAIKNIEEIGLQIELAKNKLVEVSEHEFDYIEVLK